MSRLLKALTDVDFSNQTKINNVLRSIRFDIEFFAKKNDKGNLKIIFDTLSHFLSINTKQLCQDTDKEYIVRKYCFDIKNLGLLCRDKLV